MFLSVFNAFCKRDEHRFLGLILFNNFLIEACTNLLETMKVSISGYVRDGENRILLIPALQKELDIIAAALPYDDATVFTALMQGARTLLVVFAQGLLGDFINPNGPQPALGQSIDNGVPAIFDATGGILQFGVAPGLPETPTSEQLLDPANYAFRQIQQGGNSNGSDYGLSKG